MFVFLYLDVLIFQRGKFHSFRFPQKIILMRLVFLYFHTLGQAAISGEEYLLFALTIIQRCILET